MKRTFINFQYAPVENGAGGNADNRQPITLTGQEVLNKLSVIGIEKGLRNKGKENEEEFEYARIGYADCPYAFTATPEFATALQAGDVYSVTLRPSSFTRPVMEKDADGILQETDKEETVNNFVYGNHVTWEQKEKLEDRLDKIKAISERSEDRAMERKLKFANMGLANVAGGELQ